MDKLVVLDLDETLIHSDFQEDSNADFSFTFKYFGRTQTVWTIKRPWLDDLVKDLSKTYRLGISTASVKEYAEQIVYHLGLTNKIEFLYTYENCIKRISSTTKKTDIIRKVCPNFVCVDDRRVYNNNDNLILVPEWYGQEDDILKRLPEQIDKFFEGGLSNRFDWWYV